MWQQSITEKLAVAIRASEPLTTKLCVRALSDEHDEKDVLAELDACRTLQAMKARTEIVFDDDFQVWCLPEQLGKLDD
jgi:hypothetical protein